VVRLCDERFVTLVLIIDMMLIFATPQEPYIISVLAHSATNHDNDFAKLHLQDAVHITS